jgi:gentisate 1,2-dioxygenase
MNDLGRLEDLPADYVRQLRDLNLVPLWPSLRAVLPPGSAAPRAPGPPLGLRGAAPAADARRRADADREGRAPRAGAGQPRPRPGQHEGQRAIYLGMQLLLPGEWAPSHRHTPNAVRMVVEGAAPTPRWTARSAR